MTKISIYRLERQDSLLYIRGAVGASDGRTKVVRLLIDTGARRTVLPLRLLKKFGLNVEPPARTIRVTAAGGVLHVPICPVPWFNCLGTRLENFDVLALDLPPSADIDGLLGIDFLTQVQAIIDIEKAEIRLKDAELA
jgi:predicted aspartyl protease